MGSPRIQTRQRNRVIVTRACTRAAPAETLWKY
jgi:hypothetical protein